MSEGSGPAATRNLLQLPWRKVDYLFVSHFADYVHSTCFWAGDTFAPKLLVKNQAGEEVSIQTFLQTAFLNMWETLVKAVGDLDGVLGFEVRTEVYLISVSTLIYKLDHE